MCQLVDSENFILLHQQVSVYFHLSSGIILSTWPYVFLVLEHYTSLESWCCNQDLLSAARRRWLKCSKVRIQWTCGSKHNNYDRNESNQYWGLKPWRLYRCEHFKTDCRFAYISTFQHDHREQICVDNTIASKRNHSNVLFVKHCSCRRMQHKVLHKNHPKNNATLPPVHTHSNDILIQSYTKCTKVNIRLSSEWPHRKTLFVWWKWQQGWSRRKANKINTKTRTAETKIKLK